ncbi:DnaJ domain-containing protein [Rhodospirillaceae bacterium SYSU D60014]|uniref:DnaJ domain-containing protein n=1 Tax=Virgifigura deserti TaxID=2268457 RepID=UPI000E66E69B
MLAYLFLGLLVLVGVVSLLYMYVGANPATLARVLKWAAIFLGGFAVVLLILGGRLGLVLMLIAGLMPMFMRWRAVRDRMRAASGPAGGRASHVDTSYLSMTLDHDTGELDGTVVAGRYKGRQLGDLPLNALFDLLAECRVADPQSAAVLEAYLDRTHGAEWRAQAEAGDADASGAGGAGAGSAGGSAGGRSEGKRNTPKGGMTREEAYEILGLRPGASPDEVKEAHRRLMLKNHPDHGGSTYLAAKINMAKDLLLGN